MNKQKYTDSVDLSIIILTWNSKKYTLNCIDSIYRHTPKKIKYEIILIDNGSTQNTLEEVKKRFPDVIRIRNKKNLGFAKANNQGMKIAKGEIILLLNDDTIINDDSLYRAYKFLKAQPENIGAVACKLLNPNGTLQVSCRQFYTLKNIIKIILGKSCFFLPYSIRHKLYIDIWKHDKIREVDWVNMAFFMVRKSVIDKIGGLEERFHFYGEDMEFCYRMHLNNYKLLFLNTCEIIHIGGGSSIGRYDLTKQMQNALLKFYDIYGMKIEKNIMNLWFKVKNLYQI